MADPTDEQLQQVREYMASRIQHAISSATQMLAIGNDFSGAPYVQAIVEGSIDGLAAFCAMNIDKDVPLEKASTAITARLAMSFTLFASDIPAPQGTA